LNNYLGDDILVVDKLLLNPLLIPLPGEVRVLLPKEALGLLLLSYTENMEFICPVGRVY
jgi:hypothetical protein